MPFVLWAIFLASVEAQSFFFLRLSHFFLPLNDLYSSSKSQINGSPSNQDLSSS